MSAEQYGFNLLEGVREESLEQLLADVRHISSPRSQSILGVPQLDELLESVRYPDEPPTPQRPGWTSSRAPSPDFSIDDDRGADYGDVLTAEAERSTTQQTKSKPIIIELTSQHSASGKTNLLYYLTALATLPSESGGKQSAVVWIDNDGRFSASRLVRILEHHLIQNRSDPTDSSSTYPSSKPSPRTHSSTVVEALSHIHVFRPQYSSQALTILESLPSYLLNPARHKSSHRPLGLLIIDSATAFYAQDRFDAEMARLELPLQKQGPSTKPTPPSKTAGIITHLTALQARFECAVIFTTVTGHHTNITTPNKPTSVIDDTPVISQWTLFATLTLQLERMHVPQFAPHMDLEQCLHDAEKRLEAVSKGRFTIDMLDQRTGDRIEAGTAMGAGKGIGKGKEKRVGSMVLIITEHGVMVE